MSIMFCINTNPLFDPAPPRSCLKNKYNLIIKMKWCSYRQCLYSWIVIFSRAGAGTMHNYISTATMETGVLYFLGASVNVQLTFLCISLCSRKIKNIWIAPARLPPSHRTTPPWLTQLPCVRFKAPVKTEQCCQQETARQDEIRSCHIFIAAPRTGWSAYRLC